jgi:hypothetical protein
MKRRGKRNKNNLNFKNFSEDPFKITRKKKQERNIIF